MPDLPGLLPDLPGPDLSEGRADALADLSAGLERAAKKMAPAICSGTAVRRGTAGNQSYQRSKRKGNQNFLGIHAASSNDDVSK